MAHIEHPETGDRIAVEIIDRESHYGEYLQVQAVDDNIVLSDQSGEAPWLEADEVHESESIEVEA